MSNKGQVVFYALMLGIVVVIIALALVPVVSQFTSSAMNSTDDTHVGLDCSNSSISDYTKSQCILTDATTPYFFYGLIGIALLIMFAKWVMT